MDLLSNYSISYCIFSEISFKWHYNTNEAPKLPVYRPIASLKVRGGKDPA